MSMRLLKRLTCVQCLAIIITILLPLVNSFHEGFKFTYSIAQTDSLEGIDNSNVPIYYLRMIVETTSDWTWISMTKGPLIFTFNYSIISGFNATGLKVKVYGFSLGINKKQYDQTRVELKIDALAIKGHDLATFNITKGDIGYTKIVLLVYNSASGVFVKIAEAINEGRVPGSKGKNPRSFDMDMTKAYSMVVSYGTLLDSFKEIKKKIFAFYYPWYGSPLGPSGRWIHWEGVTNITIGNSAHYPLIGPYDSSDPNVILYHIKLAKSAGIDGFIVSWWGIGETEDRNFNKMLDVADELNFKLTIYYETIRKNLYKEKIVEELEYVIRKYSNRPSFLKDDGKPVVFIYAVGARNRSPNFWLEVRRELQNRVGDTILVADTLDPSYLYVFNGFHTYSVTWIRDPKKVYRESILRLAIGLAGLTPKDAFEKVINGESINVERKSFFLTISPGYDDTKIREPGLYIDREEGRYYKKFLSSALELNPDNVIITSWNEWHEGTEIEPSLEYGFYYLLHTKGFAVSYKNHLVSSFNIKIVSVGIIFRLQDNKYELNVIIKNIGKDPLVALKVSINALQKIKSASISSSVYMYKRDIDGESMYVIVPMLRGSSFVNLTIKFSVNKPLQVLLVNMAGFDPLGNNIYELIIIGRKPLPL